jgi:6-phosphogluconolactonase
MKYALKIITVVILLLAFGSNATQTSTDQTSGISNFLIGTYTDKESQGIELLSFDQATMALSSKVVASGFQDPSFVIANQARTLIFAVEDTQNGKLRSFAFNQHEPQLTPLDIVDSAGEHPCYLALDHSERFLAVANYISGNFSVYEINSDGGLHFRQSVQHQGSSVNKVRQSHAHVHSMVFSANNKQLLVADLGTDKIHIYDVDFSNVTPITEANPAYFKVVSGSGPRHMATHPNGKVLYLVHELTGEVGVYSYENGVITHISTHLLTVSKRKGHVQAAEIRLSHDGKFIYVSNRGNANNLSVFRIELNGDLSLIQQISTGGRTPRNFNLSLDGQFLLVANQDSNEIRVFQRDTATGMIEMSPSKIKINKPVYVFPLNQL